MFREEFKDEEMVDVKSLDIRNFLWEKWTISVDEIVGENLAFALKTEGIPF